MKSALCSALSEFHGRIAEAAPASEEEAMRCLQQQDHMVCEAEHTAMMANEVHSNMVLCSGCQVRCRQCKMMVSDANVGSNEGKQKRLRKTTIEGSLNFHWEHQWHM